MNAETIVLYLHLQTTRDDSMWTWGMSLSYKYKQFHLASCVMTGSEYGQLIIMHPPKILKLYLVI